MLGSGRKTISKVISLGPRSRWSELKATGSLKCAQVGVRPSLPRKMQHCVHISFSFLEGVRGLSGLTPWTLCFDPGS